MSKIIKEEIVYDKNHITLREVVVQHKKGTKNRIILSFGGDSAIIIPIRDDGKLLVIEQYRIGSKKNNIEFPSGAIEKGETAIEAARRELLEEVGVKGELTYLGYFTPLAGVLNLKTYVFLAQNIVQDNHWINQEVYEDISFSYLSGEELDDLIINQKITDSYLLAPLQIYRSYRKMSEMSNRST